MSNPRTARIVDIGNGYVRVACPFCSGQHAHQLGTLGSREAVAHCSRPGDLRTYAIPHRNRR